MNVGYRCAEDHEKIILCKIVERDFMKYWYEETGESLYLPRGSIPIYTEIKRWEGLCADTAEFDSHAGNVLSSVLDHPPDQAGDADLLVFDRGFSCGTQTFTEHMKLEFYKMY